MKNKIIFCVLNDIVFIKNGDASHALPKERSYEFQDLDHNKEQLSSFKGIQANEAPVKCLLHLAHQEENDVKKVIYLCPDELFKKCIPTKKINYLKTFKDCKKKAISVKDFFDIRVTEFCTQNNITEPEFISLPYEPSKPAESLIEISNYLQGSYEVSIDLTGGRRDAVILLMLTAQLFKMQTTETSIDNIVYASFDDKKIYKQNTTFDLMDLANALDTFLNYGRADQLLSFFKNQKYITTETKDLCSKIEAFSNALTLCQVNSIDEKVQDVYSAIYDAEVSLRDKITKHELIQTALADLDKSEERNRNISVNNVLDKIVEEDVSINIDTSSQETLRSGLNEILQNDYTLVRCELLLSSLIPIFKEEFIPQSDNKDKLIINLIKWCVNHQMIQQALCIYRERISECLLHRGFFNATDQFNNLKNKNPEEAKGIVNDICQSINIGRIDDSNKNRSLVFQPKNENQKKRDYKAYFSINKEKYEQLHLVIIWYKYLQGVRNRIMHADSKQHNSQYETACAFLHKVTESIFTIDDLKNDILEALAYIEKEVGVDKNLWNNAFETKKESPKEQPTDITESKELIELFCEYANDNSEVKFEDFRNWCMQKKKKQLSRKGLGIPKKQNLCKGIADKYKETFVCHKDENGCDYLCLKQRKPC